MELLQQTHDVDVHWRSFQLRAEGDVLTDDHRQRILAMRPQLEQMMRENFGIELNSGPMEINSRPALIGSKVAAAHGEQAAHLYQYAMFDAYWREGEAIDDPAVLRAVATKAGLDADAFMAALDDPEYDREVQMDIALAQQIGVQAVPTLIFEKKYLVSGAQPVDTLREVVDQINAERDEART